ncbi:MAG: hypothetical protein IPK83_16280 [Planctomycetes bacterium]|nr:hypothetical protein [Planctomycetota bacterium]
MTTTEKMTDKARYEATLDEDINRFRDRLEALRSSFALTAIDLRVLVSYEIMQLSLKVSALSDRLFELRELGEAGWQRVCDGIDAARAELSADLEKLADRVG